VGDIDFHRGIVTISATIAKTDKDRKILLPDVFKEYLKTIWHLDVFNKELYIFGHTGAPGNVPLGKDTLRNRFNQVRDQLKLPKYYKFYSFIKGQKYNKNLKMIIVVNVAIIIIIAVIFPRLCSENNN
jgi:hypothetical protein